MQPQKYERITDFTEREGDDTDHSALNDEFDAAALTTDQIRANLALIQRDDGALKNGIVTADALAPSAFDAVQASVNAAVQEAQTAADSANNAAFSANTARDTAVAAKVSAETARDASQLNATSSASSAASALASKNSAAASEAASLANKNSSNTNAAAAATSATAAANSATVAGQKADLATTKAAEASSSATSSAASAAASANSAAAALTSKNNAATSETNSANSANAAASSASSASSSSSLSADWAEKLTGIVAGIGYSAKYWAQQAALAAGGGVASFNSRNGSVSLLLSDVVAALGFTPENAANKNVNNGYAGLDSSGKVPSSLLPSYVDDVLEFANLAAFPATGDAGKIYTALDTNKIYRWSGSVYVEISASPGTTDSLTEGSVNQYFTPSRASAAAPVQTVAGRSGNVTLAVADVSGAAADSAVVHTTGAETIAGVKTLSSAPVLSEGAKFSASGWSVTETSTKLYFAFNGINKASLDSSGNLIVTGNVTGNGTP